MLLASLLLISCLHSFEVLLRGREKAETMVWALRAWGVSSALIMVTIFLPSMHSWAPAEAIRSSHLDFNRASSSSVVTMGGGDPSRSGMMRMPEYVRQQQQQQQQLGMPSFHEAPAFRNGIECPFSLLSSQAQIDATCDPSAVHVAMTLDMAYLRGSMAAVLSIVQHAACPENIIFHFLVSDADLGLQALVRQTFPYLRFKVYPFDEALVKHRISSSVRSDLEQPLNYARNYLADILEPCIGRVIYLDSDLVLVDDIAKLWSTSLGEHTVGAPEYCHANFTKYFTSAFWSNSSLASAFKGRKPCYFNTGVMVMDLARWRQRDYTKLLEAWMDIQKEKKIYELGSLPPFLLVFAGWVEPIEHRWNQHGLGGDYVVGSCRPLHPGPVSLLHWSGKGKPWARLDSGRPCPLDSLWAPYDLFHIQHHIQQQQIQQQPLQQQQQHLFIREG